MNPVIGCKCVCVFIIKWVKGLNFLECIYTELWIQVVFDNNSEIISVQSLTLSKTHGQPLELPH